MGRDDLGQLTPGARADITVFAGDDLVDVPDPIAGLVLGPDRPATHVLVDGRFVVRDGEVLGIDLQAAYRELGARGKRLWDT